MKNRDEATRAAENAISAAKARWRRMSGADRAAAWAQVRQRQREALPAYRTWLFLGCPTSTKAKP
jgi:acyl-CoA reductase-like NAD-dependent aldehyde dehydrogenase